MTDDSDLVRATFYFTPDALHQLECLRLRLLTEKRFKSNKSELLRHALDCLLAHTDEELQWQLDTCRSARACRR